MYNMPRFWKKTFLGIVLAVHFLKQSDLKKFDKFQKNEHIPGELSFKTVFSIIIEPPALALQYCVFMDRICVKNC
jgi:hypothetical protein